MERPSLKRQSSYSEGKARKSHKSAPTRMEKKISPAVRAYVSKRLAVMGETKYWYDYGANQGLTSASGSTPINKNLAPVLAQGSTQYQRIGNKVKVVSAKVNGYVNILPYSAVTNPLSTPVLVKIWIVSAKQLNTTNLATTDIASSFFEVTGGSTGFQGNPLDLTLYNNSEKWRYIASRQFEIGATYASGTGPTGTGGYFDNSNMTRHFEIDYTEALKKIITYDDATTSPSNANVFMILQCVYADGQSTGTYTPAEYHYTACVTYKDV